MSYEPTVYRILIASPSDVEEERETTTRVIQDWNDLNSFNKKIVLLPLRWETHTSPAFGVRPQETINKQIVDNSDLVIGIFWTKIGSPTGVEISGSIEEIRRAAKNGKEVMLYFSKRGKDPSKIDLEQLRQLIEFKKEVYKNALVENFSSIVEFRDKLSRQLEMKIRELQKEKLSENNLISFSFVDQETGELLNNKLEIDFTRIDMTSKEISQVVENEEKASERKSDFKDAIINYGNQENNYPIVLGIKNNSSSIYTNTNVELKIETNVEKSMGIRIIGSNDNSNFDLNFRYSDLTDKNINKIRNLFLDGVSKTTEKKWDIPTESFSMLPNKLRLLKPIILLFPRKSVIVTFIIKLFSENILNPIEESCTLKINYHSRKLTKEEIQGIVENLSDEDLPF